MKLPTLGQELDTLKDVGNGAIAIFKAVVIVAIVAVILSNGSASVAIVQQGFALLIWLVSLIVSPITGGSVVDLSQPTETGAQTPSVAGTLNTLQNAANNLGTTLHNMILGGTTAQSVTFGNPSPSQTGLGAIGLNTPASNPLGIVTDNGNGTSTLTPIPSPF